MKEERTDRKRKEKPPIGLHNRRNT